MQELKNLEIFGMETLNLFNQIKLLDHLYFGGGTMLRLCHNLNRYSTDLDFWIKPKTDPDVIFQKTYNLLLKEFVVKDAAQKRSTLLFEIQSNKSKRNLKIEIRKDQTDFQWELKIAFSKFTNKQIAVKGLTLEQMMENKVSAFLSREIIRDCFDIEFLLFKGIPLRVNHPEASRMIKIIKNFKQQDFKVTLGSVLDSEERAFYTEKQFQFLKEELLKIIK